MIFFSLNTLVNSCDKSNKGIKIQAYLGWIRSKYFDHILTILRNLDFYKAFSIIKLECMNKTKKKILNTQLISKIALLILY